MKDLSVKPAVSETMQALTSDLAAEPVSDEELAAEVSLVGSSSGALAQPVMAIAALTTTAGMARNFFFTDCLLTENGAMEPNPKNHIEPSNVNPSMILRHLSAPHGG